MCRETEIPVCFVEMVTLFNAFLSFFKYVVWPPPHSNSDSAPSIRFAVTPGWGDSKALNVVFSWYLLWMLLKPACGETPPAISFL